MAKNEKMPWIIGAVVLFIWIVASWMPDYTLLFNA